jgi:hypothetical protein
MRGWDNPIYHRDPLCLFKFDGTFTGNPLICASWFLGCVQIFLYKKKKITAQHFSRIQGNSSSVFQSPINFKPKKK